MRTIPIDSTDAREQRELEREAEVAAQAVPATDGATTGEAPAIAHPTTCANGWCGEDEAGRVRPCPVCRPHLVPLHDGRVVHRGTLARRELEES